MSRVWTEGCDGISVFSLIFLPFFSYQLRFSLLRGYQYKMVQTGSQLFVKKRVISQLHDCC